ncbi:MAG: cell division protein ZapA [Paracoccaceae bacterium]
MPEVEIHIGGRSFQVACQEGEDHFLRSAAGLLDTEAQALSGVLGRIPESRMLLMAGLMLADKTAGLEEELRRAQKDLAAEKEKSADPAEPVKIEVPVVPESVARTLETVAKRAEDLANELAAAD